MARVATDISPVKAKETGQKLNKDAKARLALFEQRFDIAERSQSKRKQEWQKWQRIYAGEDTMPKDSVDMLRSKLKVPWAWQQIETIIPRVMEPEPRAEFKPVTSATPDMQLADSLHVLTQQQLYADQWVVKQRPFIEDGLVCGLGVAQVRWHQRKDAVRVRVPIDSVTKDMQVEELLDGNYQPIVVGEPEDSKEEASESPEMEALEEPAFAVCLKSMITESRPTIDWTPLEDFFPDPGCTDDHNWRWVIHRAWLTPSELAKREAMGVYTDTKHAMAVAAEGSEKREGETAEEAEARRDGKIAVYTMWEDNGKRMVVANSVMLLDGISPYYHQRIPFFAWCSQPNPRSLFGISEVDKIQELQKAVWLKDNQRIDAVNAAINFVVIADPGIQDLRKGAKIHPGKIIRAMNGQRLEQWTIGAQANLAFQETENYLGAMQQMTGANPMLQGMDPTGQMTNGTATVGNIFQEEGNKRMAMKKLYFRLFTSRIMKQMVQLSHQYLTPFELGRILQSGGLENSKMTPEDIPMFLHVMPEAMSETIGQQAERSTNVELLNILGQLHGSQMLDGTYFDIKPIVQNTLKAYAQNPRTSFREPQDVRAQQAPVPPGQGGQPAAEPTITQQTAQQPAPVGG